MALINKQALLPIVAAAGFALSTPTLSALSSIARNDPYPIFAAQDSDELLRVKSILSVKFPDQATRKKDRVAINISAGGQNADRGRNIRGDNNITTNGQVTSNPTLTELGDLMGRWNMVGLLLGDIPQGATLAPTLVDAREKLFPGITGPILDTSLIDPNQQLASFSIPLKYRKKKVAFDVGANLVCGFGVSVQMAYAHISQTVIGFHDLNCSATSACPFTFTEEQKTCITDSLTSKLKDITSELKIDITNFQESSWEEARVNLFWRLPYELNINEREWPHMLVIPFFMFTGSTSPGKEMNPSRAFALPFGNNNHNALGFTAGLSFDFVDTVEVGARAGITHFFAHDICAFRLPTHECQFGIFPYTTDVHYKPGDNWQFEAYMSAYHFVDHLSCSFEYFIIEHKHDTITVKNNDPAFKPKALEARTPWKTKLANIRFTYDISPNTGLGLCWQAPLSQRNTYRSSAVVFSFYATF